MPAAIAIKDVTKRFGAKEALSAVSLTVGAGSIFGFLGPNGAGKTTMIRCLMDYMRADAGTITILGKDAQSDSAELKRSIGYLSSDIQLHSNWTAATHLNFLGSIKGPGRAAHIAKQFNLDLGVKVRNLSSGNKQKLAIALAFLGDPKLLIMDEPTRGLDPLLQNQLYELLRQFQAGGGSVFFSSHNLTEVQQLCDEVAVIKAGQVVAAEAMKDLLRTRIHTIQAVATQAIDLKAFKAKGVEVVASDGRSISLKVRGAIDPVMKALATYKLTDLEVTHASLEDMFMEYY